MRSEAEGERGAVGVKDVPSTELSAEGSSSASDSSGRDTVDVVDRMLLSRSRSELTNRIVIQQLLCSTPTKT